MPRRFPGVQYSYWGIAIFLGIVLLALSGYFLTISPEATWQGITGLQFVPAFACVGLALLCISIHFLFFEQRLQGYLTKHGTDVSTALQDFQSLVETRLKEHGGALTSSIEVHHERLSSLTTRDANGISVLDEIVRKIGRETSRLSDALGAHVHVFSATDLYVDSAYFIKRDAPLNIDIVMVAQEPIEKESPWMQAIDEWLSADRDRILRRVVAVSRNTPNEDIEWARKHLLNPMIGRIQVSQAACREDLAVSVVTLGDSVTFFGFPLAGSKAWREGYILAFAVESEAVTKQMRKWMQTRYFGNGLPWIMKNGEIDDEAISKFLATPFTKSN